MKLAIVISALVFLGSAVSHAASAEGEPPRTESSDALQYQVLMQDYIGKMIRVTDRDGKKQAGRLVAVDAREIRLDQKKKTLSIPVSRIKKIEIKKSAPKSVAMAVGGTFLGIGLFWGALLIWALIRLNN